MALEVDYLNNCSFHLKNQTHTVQLESTDSQTNYFFFFLDNQKHATQPV